MYIGLYRAGNINEKQPPVLHIYVVEQIKESNIATVDQCALFKRQGKKLSDALFDSLPGGTIDALLVELLQRKASMLVVPFKD